MQIDGGCHCGAITFTAQADPEKVVLCHCTDCQTMSGAAFRGVVIVSGEDLEILKGEPKVYVKTAESGRKRAQAFCSQCGTQLWATSDGEGRQALYNLRLGSIAQREKLPPKAQFFTRSAQSWVADLDRIPGFETMPEPG